MMKDSPRFCISAGMPDNDEAKAGAQAGAKAGDIDSETFLEDGITVSHLLSRRLRCHSH